MTDFEKTLIWWPRTKEQNPAATISKKKKSFHDLHCSQGNAPSLFSIVPHPHSQHVWPPAHRALIVVFRRLTLTAKMSPSVCNYCVCPPPHAPPLPLPTALQNSPYCATRPATARSQWKATGADKDRSLCASALFLIRTRRYI